MKSLLKAAFLASLLASVTACAGNIIPAASAAQALHHADTGGGMTGDDTGGGMTGDDTGGGMTGDDTGGMTGDSRRKPHRRR